MVVDCLYVGVFMFMSMGGMVAPVVFGCGCIFISLSMGWEGWLPLWLLIVCGCSLFMSVCKRERESVCVWLCDLMSMRECVCVVGFVFLFVCR